MIGKPKAVTQNSATTQRTRWVDRQNGYAISSSAIVLRQLAGQGTFASARGASDPDNLTSATL
jgi:hypothetical protein